MNDRNVFDSPVATVVDLPENTVAPFGATRCITSATLFRHWTILSGQADNDYRLNAKKPLPKQGLSCRAIQLWQGLDGTAESTVIDRDGLTVLDHSVAAVLVRALEQVVQ